MNRIYCDYCGEEITKENEFLWNEQGTLKGGAYCKTMRVGLSNIHLYNDGVSSNEFCKFCIVKAIMTILDKEQIEEKGEEDGQEQAG